MTDSSVYIKPPKSIYQNHQGGQSLCQSLNHTRSGNIDTHKQAPQPLYQLQRTHYQLHSFLITKHITSNKPAVVPKSIHHEVVTPDNFKTMWSSKGEQTRI